MTIVLCEGRLSLESNVAVSRVAQTSKNTLYLVPYKGRNFMVWQASIGEWVSIAAQSQISISLSGIQTARHYDVFLYQSSPGQLALNLDNSLWGTSDTVLPDRLGVHQGILVKPNNPEYRYLGTIRAVANGLCDDAPWQRFVWNYYNRVAKNLLARPADESHTFGTGAPRNWGGGSPLISGQDYLSLLVGVGEDCIEMQSLGNVHNPNDAWCFASICPAFVDGTTPFPNADLQGGWAGQGPAFLRFVPQLDGFFAFVLTEYAKPNGTTTWLGTKTLDTGVELRSGITGTLWC